MATRGQDIASAIKREIDKFGTSLAMYDVGVVTEIGDGIARISGLASVKYNELLQFPNDIFPPLIWHYPYTTLHSHSFR